MKWSLRHKSDGKFYPWLAVTTSLMFRGFFRKLYFNNIHGVPVDAPVLLASNHPLAFMDPCLLGAYLDTPLYYMTRGDVFTRPFYRKLMESANMFPIYRRRDGYNNRDRNDEVFEYMRGKLAERKVVCVFVEGEHHLENRVRPVQKGIARSAFHAYEQDRMEDLQIVPVGVNYHNGTYGRDTALINVGEPVFVRDYWSLYEQNPSLAVRRLCEEVEIRLIEICYHVIDPADDLLAGHLLRLQRSEAHSSVLPIVEENTRFFACEKDMLDRLNDSPPEEKERLLQQTEAYFENLRRLDITDEGLMHPEWADRMRLPLFALGFLPALAGHAGLWPVLQFARRITQKRVRKTEYRTSVLMGAGHFGGVFYYCLLVAGALFTLHPFVIGTALLLPFLGWISLSYREAWQRRQWAVRAKKYPGRRQLLEMRSRLRLVCTEAMS